MPVTFTGTWTEIRNAGGPSNFCLTGAAGSTITYSSLRGSAIDLYYGTSASAVPFTYSVNGLAAVTVTPALTPGVGKVSIAVASGTHSLVITVGAAAAVIFGACCYNSAGIIVNNFAVAGTTSGSLLDATGATQYGNAVDYSGGQSAMAADLVIYALGVNDAQGAPGYAATDFDFMKNLSTVFDRYRKSNVGAVDILVVMNNIGTHQGIGPNYYSLCARARALCEEYGAGYISIGAQFRNSHAYAVSRGFFNDYVHPNDTGMSVIADIVLPWINTTDPI